MRAWATPVISDHDPLERQMITALMDGDKKLAIVTWFSPQGPFYTWVHGVRLGGVDSFTWAKAHAEAYIDHGHPCPNCGRVLLPGRKCLSDGYVDPRERT